MKTVKTIKTFKNCAVRKLGTVTQVSEYKSQAARVKRLPDAGEKMVKRLR